MAPNPEEVCSSARTHMGVRGLARQMFAKLREGCAGGTPMVTLPEQRPTRAQIAATAHPKAATAAEGSVANATRSDLGSARATAVAERDSRWGDRALDPLAFIPERVNSQIAQRYKIDKHEIGAGGYGKVFVAEDREIKGRRVAIKKVSALRRSRREEFKREAAVMKMLDHPNICKLLETYDCGESVFLVMEYCDGGNLLDRIFHGASKTRHSGLSEDMCANIIRQIAGALDHAHARGIAHRDLKPENVCLIDTPVADPHSAPSKRRATKKAAKPKTHVKVIDWGLSAYFQHNLRCMRSNVGSVAYAAPEVLEGSSKSDGYTSACDIWSLGVLTYVSLSGRFPFSGSNSSEQVGNIRSGHFSFAGAEWSDVSGIAKDFVSSCLRRDPSTRPTASTTMEHRWLRREVEMSHVDAVNAKRVLKSLWQSSVEGYPLSVYASLVARQMDHQSLHELPQVFQDLDLDGDGELDLSEIKSAFETTFGSNSKELRDIEQTFKLLDLDGSGSINYTEFIAAGLGDRMRTEESLKAAFKAFDIDDNDNRITRNEFEHVVTTLHVSEKTFAAEKVFSEFDTDGDGTLDFDEWKAWISTLGISGARGGA
mmetsp:Transcript_136372/g.340040  ORF Transcript_136372/g.340040 Transcript_136372/m.340040 type:complete len:598 (-) Transcript_136372:130-1923(-)